MPQLLSLAQEFQDFAGTVESSSDPPPPPHPPPPPPTPEGLFASLRLRLGPKPSENEIPDCECNGALLAQGGNVLLFRQSELYAHDAIVNRLHKSTRALRRQVFPLIGH